MIPSCKNCLYCDIKKNNERITQDGETWYGVGLKTYICKKDNLFKNYDNLCSKWEHKNKLIRKLWRYFND